MSRVIRGATIAVREAPYIESARAVSASTPRLILVHTIPNIFAPAAVVATLAVGNAILAEAALSFLGFGVVPPTPSWGQELSSSGRTYLQIAPWLAIFPGLAITIAVFAFNMLGDALRDALDPRLRNT
jgi:peptide/nickel transport system permease protein